MKQVIMTIGGILLAIVLIGAVYNGSLKTAATDAAETAATAVASQITETLSK